MILTRYLGTVVPSNHHLVQRGHAAGVPALLQNLPSGR